MFSRSSQALLLFALVLGACAHPEKPAVREAVDARVTAAQRASLASFHSVAGTVRAETTSTLSANVVGTVVRVLVAEGDRVRSGQVLVEIDPRERRAQVDRTRAGREEVERAIEAAAANVQLAEATHRRSLGLRAQGLVSQQEYDVVKARHTAAQAEWNGLVARRSEARAAAAQAEAVLDFSSVRAPIDGVVSARFVDPGAQAAPGVPLITIENEQAVRVDANVPDGVAVHAGDRAIVEAGDRRAGARVTRVQPSVDSAARSALVKLQLDEPLRAGTYVKVSFPAGARDAVTVPPSALVRRGQLTSVFVVGSDGVARMRLVTVGSTDGAQAEILSGLAAGEEIVADPARVRDGVLVRRSA
ncbi:MAG TPA: efflux RND transporter periplasmic adaptor subunit [Thermoanaerobaculia bacterium]|nr:efflux RND transporter periplasmic adaptor subunit [Thermoanaerobaculia bacterium]